MTREMPRYARNVRAFDATMKVIGGIIGAGIVLNPADLAPARVA